MILYKNNISHWLFWNWKDLFNNKYYSIIKLELFLKKFKGDNEVKQIINNYVNKLGFRYKLLFDICNTFCKYTKKPFYVESLSRIIFKNKITLKGYLDLEQTQLDPLFKLEYFISRFSSNSRYFSNPNIVNQIKIECIQIIRKYLTDNNIIPIQLNQEVFNLMWDSLYALSDIKTEKMRASTGNNDVMVAATIGDLGEIMSKALSSENRRMFIKQIIYNSANPRKSSVRRLMSNLQWNYFYSPISVQKALDSCSQYLSSRDSRNSNWYDEDWYDESVKSYHITMGLARNLGFDILHFQSLDDSIFSLYLSNIYARHHFRHEWNRKKSIYIKDIVLTDNRFHRSYEKYIRTIRGEQSIENILKGFEEFMSFDRDITEADIQQTFNNLGEEWVYHLWKSQGQKTFNDNLKLFNQRKILYRSQGIEAFMKDPQLGYKIAYERFYGQYGIGIDETFARAPGVGDYLPGSGRYLGTLT